MGFTPVHQRRCSTGLRSNEAPASAGLNYSHPGRDRLGSRLPAEKQPVSGYTLSGIPGHVEGVPPPGMTLSFDPDNWHYQK